MHHPPDSIDSKTIGLALSGGGFRASAFHLGVLKRLEEVGVLQEIAILSTVSGGSITGALYALRCAQSGEGRPGDYPVEALIEDIRPVLLHNLRRQALFSSIGRSIKTIASFVSRRVRRMSLITEELDRQIFDEARLTDMPDWIVVNATNLATGKCWKFFHDRVGDYLVGATDQTASIRIAEAVGASAAYPVLTDPYPFESRWEHFRSDLLDERWQRPPQRRPGDISPWRRRYGKAQGRLTLPLVDGGVYDNEGLNSMRSMNVDYAIYSSAATAESAYTGSGLAKDLLQTVFSMHSRLGAITRQHAHEMTHGTHPDQARSRLISIAGQVESLNKGKESKPAREERLHQLAKEIRDIADVGRPPRGFQFRGIAPIVLNNTSIAKNRSASYNPPYDIKPENRGLVASLVQKLARVRTDLDAHHPQVLDLLIAQGYFSADAHLTIGMPELLQQINGTKDPRNELTPSWAWAHDTVERANANEAATAEILAEAAKQNYLRGKDSTR